MDIMGAILPAAAPALGAMITGALGNDSTLPPAPIGVENHPTAAIAVAEMRDPDFWQAPPPDWQRDAIASGIGLVLGLFMASQIWGHGA